MDFRQDSIVCMTGAMLCEMSDTTQNTKATVSEIASLRAELEQARQELARYKAEQADRYEQDLAQHVKERASDNRQWKTAFVVSTLLAVSSLVVAIIALLQ